MNRIDPRRPVRNLLRPRRRRSPARQAGRRDGQRPAVAVERPRPPPPT